jgi:hypothetical protein
MGIWRFSSAWRVWQLGGWRTAGTALAVLLGAAILAVACGDAKPAQEFFSRSEEVIQELVPEAQAFRLGLGSVGEESGTHVDMAASTLLEGEPRMHVLSDADAVADADLVGEYEGFSIYKQKATFWGELVAEAPPLYAGTASNEGLEAYIDFYRAGEPKLSDERFWNGFDYARERVGEALQEAPSQLVVDFDGVWKPEAGGMRFQVVLGERRLDVAVLYAREGVEAGDQGFDQDLVEAFKQQFAVPAEAEDQGEVSDWGYDNRIWYADTGTGTGEG